MKHIRKFNEEFNPDGEVLDTLKSMESSPKISSEFEAKADALANLILASEEYSNLVDMANSIQTNVDGENFNPFKQELKNAFPKFKEPSEELVNTGVKIPFYGRTKNAPFQDEHPVLINFYKYMINKIKNPGYKY